MKRIEAVIKPFKLDEVKDAIQGIVPTGITVYEAKGFGNQKGHSELYRGKEYVVDYLPKIALICVVEDDRVDAVVEAIANAAWTGRRGDGRITVGSVDQFWNIRTKQNEADKI